MECCAYSDDCSNGECPYEHGQECIRTLMLDALSLINRQKAEIEMLKTNLSVELENFASEYDNKIKSEAIKEFAERLKFNVTGIPWCEYGPVHREIDNLVKEMVGEDK